MAQQVHLCDDEHLHNMELVWSEMLGILGVVVNGALGVMNDDGVMEL